MQPFLERWFLDPTVARLAAAGLGLLVLAVVLRFVQRRIAPQIRDLDARYRTRKAITFVGYFLAVVLLVAIFSEQLGNFTVAFGVAGAGVAFALQEVIASVAGWVEITVARPFSVGDRIALGGRTGDVIDIGVLRTTLMEIGGWVNGDLYNGRMVKIANSAVFKEPITNYSADFPFLWDEIAVPVRHGSDVSIVHDIITRAAGETLDEYSRKASDRWKRVVQRYRIEEASVAPTVTMVADENWMTFTLRYVVDYRRRRSTKDSLWRLILNGFSAASDRVAIASTSLFVEAAPVNVTLAQTRG